MGVAERVLAFDSLYGAQTGIGEHLQTFDSFYRARMGVVLAFELCYYKSNF